MQLTSYFAPHLTARWSQLACVRRCGGRGWCVGWGRGAGHPPGAGACSPGSERASPRPGTIGRGRSWGPASGGQGYEAGTDLVTRPRPPGHLARPEAGNCPLCLRHRGTWRAWGRQPQLGTQWSWWLHWSQWCCWHYSAHTWQSWYSVSLAPGSWFHWEWEWLEGWRAACVSGGPERGEEEFWEGGGEERAAWYAVISEVWNK